MTLYTTETEDRNWALDNDSRSTLEPTSLVDLLCHRACYQSSQRAFAFLEDGETKETSLTYGELDQQARGIAALLERLGATGKRVLLLYPPGLDYIAAFFGCLYAGAVAVPIYPPRPNRTLARLQEIVTDAGATVALTTRAILSALKHLVTDSPALEAVRWLDTEDIPATLAQTWRSPEIRPHTLAFLQYTSGSTSQPKGVMVSHGNLIYNARMTHRAFEHDEQSAYVSWLPLYHDMGLIGNVLQPLYVGVPSILMSPLVFLQKPVRWLKAISRYKAQISGGPNFAYDLCVRKVTPEQRASLDLSSWSIAFNGAEPVRPDTLARFTEAFRDCGFRPEAFYPCYGLAEATLFVSGGLKAAQPALHAIEAESFERGRVLTASVESAASRTLVGCGRTWLDQRIVIADPETLIECAPDQIGEIWLSGPNITQGYWNRAEETERTFQAFLANTGEGPFLRTGDLGFTKDGELFVVGRLKDLIIIDGRNHYPQDIEQTVERSHEAIRPGCCAAFAIEVHGQERLVIVAEVDGLRQTRPASTPPDGDSHSQPRSSSNFEPVARLVRRAVAEHHDLQAYALRFVKVGGIPKTSSGKLRRSACRTAFLSGHLAGGENE